MISRFSIENSDLKMNEVTFVKDDGWLADNTSEYWPCTEPEMNSEILKFIAEHDCTVTSLNNAITMEQRFEQ